MLCQNATRSCDWLDATIENINPASEGEDSEERTKKAHTLCESMIQLNFVRSEKMRCALFVVMILELVKKL